MAIVVNKSIPEFEANATGGIKVSNSSHLGQILVLYFYPKDNTPGCTTEAMQFRDKYKDYIEDLNMLSNMRLCSNVPGQWAIQTALGGYQSINDLVCEGGRLRRQRDLAYELITAIPGVSCVKPTAALYMFPRLDPAVYPIKDDQQFFLELLEETRVMLVQGTGFNWPDTDHFRIVFLPHEDDLREAIGRIARFLEQYRKRSSVAV